mmetsp:Transcript_3164/g.9271  ORF Transcript_3164/g.9271 Transcript_3164/m.9271 type:complete len:218 (+) Transcript_3164:535-1188(+)
MGEINSSSTRAEGGGPTAPRRAPRERLRSRWCRSARCSSASSASRARRASSLCRSGRKSVSASGHFRALAGGGAAASSSSSPKLSMARCLARARLAARPSFFGAALGAAGSASAGAALDVPPAPTPSAAARYSAAVWSPPPESTVLSTVLSNLSSMRPRPRAASASIWAFFSSKAFWSSSRCFVRRPARPPATVPSTVCTPVSLSRPKPRCIGGGFM